MLKTLFRGCNQQQITRANQTVDPAAYNRTPSSARLWLSIPGLHNSESSKGQIIITYLPRTAKVYTILMLRFPCNVEEIPKCQLLIRSQAFVTFLTIEKPLAGRKKSFRGPYVVETWFIQFI